MEINTTADNTKPKTSTIRTADIPVPNHNPIITADETEELPAEDRSIVW